jgi:Domain of unknown function (DUF1707)
MSLVGDRERERAAASLRRHFVQGRLTVEELGARAELALGARSQLELRAALRDLPRPWQAGSDLLASAGASVRRGVRLAVFLLLAGVWAVVTLALAIAFAVTLAAFGPSLPAVLVFAALWAAVTLSLWRAWMRAGRRPA